MDILLGLIVSLGMLAAWWLGKQAGWTKGFNDGIEFRNKQLKKL